MQTNFARSVVPHKRRSRLLPLLLLLVATTSVAEATRPRAMPLATRTRLAERIVVGRVTGVRVGTHPRYPRVVVTHVTLRVRESWKGPKGETLSFMQFGDASATRREPEGERFRRPQIPGMPGYAVGEEIILFLHRPSGSGFTSPVGGVGGKIPVRRGADGTPGIGEATLTQGGETGMGPVLSLPAARARVEASLREGESRP